MKKRILLIVLGLCITLAVLSSTVLAAADPAPLCDGTHAGYTEWKNTTYLPSYSGKYVLTEDVTLSSE